MNVNSIHLLLEILEYNQRWMLVLYPGWIPHEVIENKSNRQR